MGPPGGMVGPGGMGGIQYSLFPIQFSFRIPCSLFDISYSLFFIPYTLFRVHCSIGGMGGGMEGGMGGSPLNPQLQTLNPEPFMFNSEP
jgi:hypothetical protein